MPDVREGGPRVENLQPWRLTRVKPTSRMDGTGVMWPTQHVDGWEEVDFNDPSNYRDDLGFEWRGFTVFIEKENVEKPSGRYDDIVAPHELQAEDVPLMPSAAAARPRALPSPSEPSEQERELHNLTHLPYRSWCPVCVCSVKGEAFTS